MRGKKFPGTNDAKGIDIPMREFFRLLCVALILPFCWFCAPGCGPSQPKTNPDGSPVAKADPGSPGWKVKESKSRKGEKVPPAQPLALSAVDLSDAVTQVMKPDGVKLAAARNEWTSFVLQVGPRTPGANYGVRVNTPAGSPIADVSISQVLSMAVDVNRAGYVRHTGHEASRGELPRALLAMPMNPGGVDLAKLRDASRPTDPAAVAPSSEPCLLWVDVRVPADAPAGDYAATVEAITNGEVVASVPVALKVHDFTLPTERHLQVVGRLMWDDLERLYPDRFEAIRPRLVNRHNPAYTGAVAVIDSLMKLAHTHRTSVVVPRLQPTVKWPPNASPEIDWTDFDSLVGPWLTGDAFDDKMPTGVWPLPSPDMLDRYVRPSQLQYWSQAATHFDQNDWLDRSPVFLEKVTPGRATDAESADLSKNAAEVLAQHQRVRVALPLETDQLAVADPAMDDAEKAKRLDATTTTRLWSAAPALVFAPPLKIWPEGADRPRSYLRTDMPALVPYVGAGGDERDVRLWAWLAFLRQSTFINFADALPSLNNPTDSADPNELIWFYPGEWFGQTEPVPTIQLKWLRRAQQDYEYLWLAREQGNRFARINTLLMSQLITKPVEIQPGQHPDPAYALMTGTTKQAVWDEAQRLLTEMILMRGPIAAAATQPAEIATSQPAAVAAAAPAIDPAREHAFEIEMFRWAEPQERPLLMARTAEWRGEFTPTESLAHLRLGVDIYNASATTPDENLLGWTAVPQGWEIDVQPITIPVLSTYNVRRATLDATFNLNAISPNARFPMQLTFTNGHNRDRTASLPVILPIATSDRREGTIKNNGILDDWEPADLIHEGKLVKMLSRPNLQAQKLEPSALPSKVYTSWAAGNFYVAFDVAGVSPTGTADGGKAQNFADYQFRRAWGADLCEILIQPLGADGMPGPVLHVVCKPNGSIWVARKLPALAEQPPEKAYQEIEARIPYTATIDGDKWRGEVSIPWRAILAAAGNEEVDEPPTLLRFNFAQHRHATGESATWSGPVDFGRDESLMGILYLRDPKGDGPRNLAGNREESIGNSTQER